MPLIFREQQSLQYKIYHQHITNDDNVATEIFSDPTMVQRLNPALFGSASAAPQRALLPSLPVDPALRLRYAVRVRGDRFPTKKE